jgi:predicted transcriptional regulator
MNDEQPHHLIELTVDLASAYVSNNHVEASEIGKLVTDIYTTLKKLTTADDEVPMISEKPKPAVNPKKSVQPDFIICLEDGKQFKSLKRHIKTHYNLTPEQYRKKWDLPADYPMVAANYAAKRSSLAKKMGLGRKSGPVKSAA